MRDRLIELLKKADKYASGVCTDYDEAQEVCAEYLLAEGVIVPPCKVGDTVYKVCTVNSRIKFGSHWDGKVVESNCDRCGYRNAYCRNIGLQKHEHELMVDVIVEKKVYDLVFLVDIMPYFGKVWFTTKEEAEKALAERRGE